MPSSSTALTSLRSGQTWSAVSSRSGVSLYRGTRPARGSPAGRILTTPGAAAIEYRPSASVLVSRESLYVPLVLEAIAVDRDVRRAPCRSPCRRRAGDGRESLRRDFDRGDRARADFDVVDSLAVNGRILV